MWHGADLEPDPLWLCMQHGLGNDLLAAYKLHFLGLDLAQLAIDDLDTIPRGSLDIEEPSRSSC